MFYERRNEITVQGLMSTFASLSSISLLDRPMRSTGPVFVDIDFLNITPIMVIYLMSRLL